MSVRVGVNGFGRIGRLVVRAAAQREIDVVGVNDVMDVRDAGAPAARTTPRTVGIPARVEVDGDALVVDGRRIRGHRRAGPGASWTGRPSASTW